MVLFGILSVGIIALPAAIMTLVMVAILLLCQISRERSGKNTFSESASSLDFDPLPDVEQLDENPQEILFRKIAYHMDQEHLYLNNALSINELTTLCCSNRTYVSNCINDMTGQSFTDFVNSYRIHYAQVLMSIQANDLTMSKVGEMSGFSNSASFIRNFKKFTGTTPMEWYTQHKSQRR